MTAYSFRPRFIASIQAGTKRQTIRAKGKRPHAQPGRLVQIYTGMRTRACQKIVPDVVCESVVPVTFDLRQVRDPIEDQDEAVLTLDRRQLVGSQRHAFALQDGFASFGDMVDFWLAEHGAVLFDGVCIRWRPVEKERATAARGGVQP